MQENWLCPAPLVSPKYTAPLAKPRKTIQVINEQVLKRPKATTLTEVNCATSLVAGNIQRAKAMAGSHHGDAIYMRGFDVQQHLPC